MALSLWRCRNPDCGTRAPFEAERGVCPKCKLPECVQLLPVHYLVPAEGPIRTELGNRMVACAPDSPHLPQSTGLRAAVTCPKCRATALFAEDERDNVNNHVRHFERHVEASLNK